MRRDKSVFIIGVTVFALASFLFSGVFAGDVFAQTKTLKIGLISSVTGPLAPAFKSELVAAQPTAELVNQMGGITVGGQKYRIEILTADDQSSPAGAVSAANKLLQEGIKFIVSPMMIPNNMAIASVCEEAKVLRVKPNCVEPSQFGPPNRYSFNAEATNYNVPFMYSKIMALYPQVKRVAIIRPDDPGAITITGLTEKEIRKRGLEVVLNEAYPIPTEDFYPILTKALAQKPDAIECIFSIIPWAKGIVEQAREMGFTGPITAVTSLGDANILKAVIDPKYAYDICHATPDVKSPKMPKIVQDLGKLVEKNTGEKFNFDHVLTLQALKVMVQGIEKAQSFDVDKVTKALENMKRIETPYGSGFFGGQEIIGINRLMVRTTPFSRIVKGGNIEFEFLPGN